MHKGREEENVKRLAKWVLRAALMLLALALAAGLAVGAVFAVRGYNLYRQAADERPLEQMVAEIQSQETYVPFEDLPDLYVDAVVSVEDKRFWSHPGIDPIAICRALLADSDVILMDEPFTGLDEQTKQHVIGYIKEKTAGKLVLITTHQEEDVALLGGVRITLKGQAGLPEQS